MIDTIATANYERFASSVKEFAVYGSPVYPTASWAFLGYFQADDTSDLQAFAVNTATWTKWVWWCVSKVGMCVWSG